MKMFLTRIRQIFRSRKFEDGSEDGGYEDEVPDMMDVKHGPGWGGLYEENIWYHFGKIY